jgi:hypothetical protein
VIRLYLRSLRRPLERVRRPLYIHKIKVLVGSKAYVAQLN